MTNSEWQHFMQLVSDMRKSQREFFNCKDKAVRQTALFTAKKLERQVDDIVFKYQKENNDDNGR